MNAAEMSKFNYTRKSAEIYVIMKVSMMHKTYNIRQIGKKYAILIIQTQKEMYNHVFNYNKSGSKDFILMYL